MNFILLFIQFLVALVSVVAKLLPVAPHPHIDFGYLGFSFFFLHILFLPFDIAILFCVCGIRCLHLQFNVSCILLCPWRCFFTVNVTDILNVRSEWSFMQLAFVFNYLFILNTWLYCTSLAVLFVVFVHI